MEFKILFGCLNMDNFPQTNDEIRDLKSITLEMIEVIKCKMKMESKRGLRLFQFSF